MEGAPYNLTVERADTALSVRPPPLTFCALGDFLESGRSKLWVTTKNQPVPVVDPPPKKVSGDSIAIFNQRLVRLEGEDVVFTWKDYAAGDRSREREMTISGPEFLRRFLLHVLPDAS